MKRFFMFDKMAIAAALALLLNACDKDVFDINSDPFKGQSYAGLVDAPIATYLTEQEGYEEYVNLLHYSNMFNALNQSSSGTSFTAFVPTNDAMSEFYQRRGVSSLEGLTPEYAREFVLYHTVKDSILPDDFINKTSVQNLNQDVITISIDTTQAGQAVLNGEGRVVEMGLSAFNGKIYVLSRAMTPLVETVYDRIADKGTSKIMVEALNATGWDCKLSTVVDTTLNQDGQRVITHYYYTMFDVSDATFAKNGITSLSDLKSKLKSTSKEALDEDSLLRQYVGYHILQNSYTTDALGTLSGSSTTRIWSASAKNQVFTVSYDSLATDEANKYVLNAAGESARFVTGQKNVLAKNGYMHELDSWLPVWEPEQTEVLWDLADNIDIRNIVELNSHTYQPTELPSSQEITNVSNAACFEYTMGEAGTNNNSYHAIDYVTYNLKQVNNYDRLVFNLGYMGQVTMNTPTIVRGKYRVELTCVYLSDHGDMRQQKNGSNGGLLKLTFDDSAENTIFQAPYTKAPSGFPPMVFTTTLYDEIEFTETASHRMSFVVLDPAASTHSKFSLQFDCIRFIPIENQ